jgi:hypothetical protein
MLIKKGIINYRTNLVKEKAIIKLTSTLFLNMDEGSYINKPKLICYRLQNFTKDLTSHISKEDKFLFHDFTETEIPIERRLKFHKEFTIPIYNTIIKDWGEHNYNIYFKQLTFQSQLFILFLRFFDCNSHCWSTYETIILNKIKL